MLKTLSEHDSASRRLDAREAATASLFQTWFDGVTWGPFRPIFFTVKTYWWEEYDEHLDALQDLDDWTLPCTPGWAGILASLQAAFDKRNVPLPSISRSAFLALGRDFERRSERLHQWHLNSPEEFCHYFCSTLYRLCTGAIPSVAVAVRVYIPGDMHEDALTSWHAQYSSQLSYLREKLATDWSANIDFTPQTWGAGITCFLKKVFADLGLSPPCIPPCVLYQLFREVDTDGTHALNAEECVTFVDTILHRITQLHSVALDASPDTPCRHSERGAPCHAIRPSRWFPVIDDQHDTTHCSLAEVADRAQQHRDAAEVHLAASTASYTTDDGVCMETPRKKLVAAHVMNTPPRASSAYDVPADGDQMRGYRTDAQYDIEPERLKHGNASNADYETSAHLLPPFDSTAASISKALRRSVPSRIQVPCTSTQDNTTIGELRAELAAQDAAHIAAVRQKEAEYEDFQRAVHSHVLNLEQEFKDLQRESADESSELHAISAIVQHSAKKYLTGGSPHTRSGAGAGLAATPGAMASMSTSGAQLDKQLTSVLAHLEKELAEACASSTAVQNAMAQQQSLAEEQANARVREVEVRFQREMDTVHASWRDEMAETILVADQKWNATVETWRNETQELKKELHLIHQKSQGDLGAVAATWKEKEVEMEVKNVMLLAEIQQRDEALQKRGRELQQSLGQEAAAVCETERITQILEATKQDLSNTEDELASLQAEHQRTQREAAELQRTSEDKAAYFTAEQEELRNKEHGVQLIQRELRQESRTAELHLEELKHVEESTARQLSFQQQELEEARKQVHSYQDRATEVESQARASEARFRVVRREIDLDEARLRTIRDELEEHRANSDEFRSSTNALKETAEELRTHQLALTHTAEELHASELALTMTTAQLRDTSEGVHTAKKELAEYKKDLCSVTVELREERRALSDATEDARAATAEAQEARVAKVNNYETALRANADVEHNKTLACAALTAAREEMKEAICEKQAAQKELHEATEHELAAHTQANRVREELEEVITQRAYLKHQEDKQALIQRRDDEFHDTRDAILKAREAEIANELSTETKTRKELERQLALEKERTSSNESRHIEVVLLEAECEQLQNTEAAEAAVATQLLDAKMLAETRGNELSEKIKNEAKLSAEATKWRESARELGLTLKRIKHEFLEAHPNTFRDRAKAEHEENITWIRKTRSMEEDLRKSNDKVQKTMTALRIASEDTESVVQEMQELKRLLAEEKSFRWHCKSELNEVEAHKTSALLRVKDLEEENLKLRHAAPTAFSPKSRKLTTTTTSVTPRRKIRRTESERMLSYNEETPTSQSRLASLSNPGSLRPSQDSGMFSRLATLEKWIEQMKPKSKPKAKKMSTSRSEIGLRTKRSVSPDDRFRRRL